MDNFDPNVAELHPEGASAALMGPQLRPRDVQQHRAADRGKVGEFGVPHGDAVRAENGAATVAQLAAAAAEKSRKASYGEIGVPHGDAVRAKDVAAPAAYYAAAAEEESSRLLTVPKEQDSQ